MENVLGLAAIAVALVILLRLDGLLRLLLIVAIIGAVVVAGPLRDDWEVMDGVQLTVLARGRGQSLVRYENEEVRCIAIWPWLALGSSLDCDWKKPLEEGVSFKDNHVVWTASTSVGVYTPTCESEPSKAVELIEWAPRNICYPDDDRFYADELQAGWCGPQTGWHWPTIRRPINQVGE